MILEIAFALFMFFAHTALFFMLDELVLKGYFAAKLRKRFDVNKV